MTTAIGQDSRAWLGPALTPPNPGELDCLAVLWASPEPALKLSEIHQLVGGRRRRYGEAPPALTTVSSQLRGLVEKGLLVEVTVGEDGRPVEATPEQPVVRVRGAVCTRGSYLAPAKRSPLTGYRAACEPGPALDQIFKDLAEAYPPDRRLQALIDMARCLAVPETTIRQLEELLLQR